MIEVRGFLREATSALHRELDAMVGVFSSRDDYARFLQGTFRHRAPVETALQAVVVTPRLSSQGRRLLPELKADLADLAQPLPAVTPFSLPSDRASVLGALYVLEGSALGARVLVKSAHALGFGSEFGARYLSAQAGSLDSWRALLAELDGLERPEWEAAARASRAIFAHAIEAFRSEEFAAA